MSEHKAYDDLKSKLTTIAETDNQEGIRAAIALAYLEKFGTTEVPVTSSEIRQVARIMEATVTQ